MSVQRWFANLTVISCVLGTVAVIASAESGSAPTAWLITPEEAAMPPATGPRSGGGLIEVGRDELCAGPVIEILKPSDGAQAVSPLNVLIRFSPRAEPVDLASLKVSLVQFLTLDITDRIRPYTTTEGIQLTEAKIPSGQHRVWISVLDTAGSISAKDLVLDVL